MSSFNKLIATYNITQDLFEDPWYGFVSFSNSEIQNIITSAELNGVTIENFNGYVDLIDAGFSAAGEYVLTLELNTDTLPGYIFDIRHMPPILISVVVPPCVKYIGQAAFNSNEGLTNITLPYGLLTIGGGAFNDAGFSSITIPSTIERIDDAAFNLSGNSGLSEFSVVINAEIPPVLNDFNQGTFSPLNKLRGIYVPPGTAEAYKNAERWSYYSDYIFEQYVNPMRKNWVDITTIDNNTPFYDVAWSFSAHTDGEISFGDRWFAERPGLVTDDEGWGGGGPIEMGRYGFHRFNSSFSPGFYTCNFDETNTDPGNIPNCGYTVSMGDTHINTLPNVETISGTPCYCLGLREWWDWKPLYGAYSGMSTMFEPGNIFVQLASSGATNKNMQKAYVGNTQVKKIYLGADVVWDYSLMPMRFRIIQGGTIKWTHNQTVLDDVGNLTISYRINGGSLTNLTSSTAGVSFSVNSGDIVEFTGDNARYGSLPLSYNTFSGSTAVFEAYGNTMSLVSSTGYTEVANLTQQYAFNRLFAGCTGLTNAEHLVLPTTTLPYHVYTSLFENCTSLVKSPVLPAATLTNSCYDEMFKGCTSLAQITCLATNISATNCLYNWVSGVSATGTFVKAADMSSWGSGNSGVPNGWTITDKN